MEGAFLAIGGTLWKVKVSRVNMVLVREATVNRLTGHLLVPLAICTSNGHRRSRLQKVKRARKSKDQYILKQSSM